MPYMREQLSTYQVPIAVAVAATTLVIAAALGVTAPVLMLATALAFAAALAGLRLSASQWLEGRQGRGEIAQAGRPAEASWRAIVDAMTDPAIVLNREGRVLHWSRAARELFVNLRDGQALLQVSRNPDLLAAVEAAAAAGSVRTAQLLERVPIERRLSVTISPLREANGVFGEPALLLVFRDVSEEERLAQMRADFIANASHELRTPLAALLGFIETLQGPARDDPAARARFLGIMQAQATRMARLIDDLLSLSRIELNAHLQPNTPVELAPIVRQVVDGLQMLARDREVEIRVSLPDEPLAVLGDRDELIRALENLVENALKYGAAGKRVDITLARGQTRAGAAEARLAVRDYGPGIAPEHVPRLTERFYRVDVSDSRAQGGTGLGLALVKHVLNRHGGRLSIESVPGAGATFTMQMPLHPANPAQPADLSEKSAR
jgi:two-component system phosphate regulon sensor histidine kinase PhoR